MVVLGFRQNPFVTISLFIFFAVLLIFPLYRNADENRWSHWEFGDCQTLMAVDNWLVEGFKKLHFLWVPQGYSHVNEWIDTPSVNHHAHGVSGNFQNGTRYRRIYTHYPSFYAVPYGVLAYLGLSGKYVFQVVASWISVLSLVFLFLFFKRSFGVYFALIAAFRYVLTPSFLRFNDSLATMPWDDLFRWSFLWVWLIATEKGGRWYFIALGCFFLSSLVSIDNIAFLLLWVLLLRFYSKTPSLKYCSVLLVAPLFAFTIQFLQNSAYLGMTDALSDWKNIFTLNWTEPQFGAFSLTIFITKRIFANGNLLLDTFHLNSFFLLLQCAIFCVCLFLFDVKIRKKIVVYAIGFFIAGSGYGFLFPTKLTMSYQIRQFLPFLTLINATIVLALVYSLLKIKQSFQLRYVVAVMLTLYSTFYLKLLYTGTLIRLIDMPAEVRIDPHYRNFLTSLNARYPGEKIVLEFGDIFPHLLMYGGHWQTHPCVECYAKGPVFNFLEPSSLISDLQYFWSKRRYDFTPIVVYSKRERENLSSILNRAGLCLGSTLNSNELVASEVSCLKPLPTQQVNLIKSN